MDWELGTAPGRSIRLRAAVVAGIFAVGCFGVLLGRLYYIQFVRDDLDAPRAAGQQLRGITVTAPRGTIYDANLEPLAVSATAWTIRAVPREMADEDVQPAAAALAEILELDAADVLEKLSQRSSNDALLRRRVDKEMADAVRLYCAENGVEGILVLEDSRRYYPQGDLAGSILGFVNVDGDGVAGLELEYNSRLKGEDGSLLAAKNAWGYPLPDLYETLSAPTQGSSLVLTIDKNIQSYLENYLSRAVAEYNVQARGVGIVMDVDTGAILAMSTKPDYDPNQPRLLADQTLQAQIDALPDDQRAEALSLAQQAQWRNKAVSDLYEPGSVFKIITASAALDSGAVTRQTIFPCRGAIQVSGTTFHCANGKIHGSLNIADALLNSCNCSFIQIGAALGRERFYQYFEAFGLTGATGIDLPAEPKKSEFYTAERMGPVELARQDHPHPDDHGGVGGGERRPPDAALSGQPDPGRGGGGDQPDPAGGKAAGDQPVRQRFHPGDAAPYRGQRTRQKCLCGGVPGGGQVGHQPEAGFRQFRRPHRQLCGGSPRRRSQDRGAHRAG